MDTLMLDQPLATAEPVVMVDPRLPAGLYRAELVVVDRAGTASVPATLDLEIRDPRQPTGPTRPVVVEPLRPVVTGPVAPPPPVGPVAPPLVSPVVSPVVNPVVNPVVVPRRSAAPAHAPAPPAPEPPPPATPARRTRRRR
jgi:hypothetical protein